MATEQDWDAVMYLVRDFTAQRTLVSDRPKWNRPRRHWPGVGTVPPLESDIRDRFIAFAFRLTKADQIQLRGDIRRSWLEVFPASQVRRAASPGLPEADLLLLTDAARRALPRLARTLP